MYTAKKSFEPSYGDRVLKGTKASFVERWFGGWEFWKFRREDGSTFSLRVDRVDALLEED